MKARQRLPGEKQGKELEGAVGMGRTVGVEKN